MNIQSPLHHAKSRLTALVIRHPSSVIDLRYLLLALFAFFAYTVAVYAAEPDAAAAADTGPRALFQLSYADAEGAISAALSQKGAGSKIAAAIVGRKAGPLFSYTHPVSVEIHGLQFEKPTSTWTANLMVMSEQNVVTAMPVSGRFEEMAEVPVLKREIRNGDIIKAVDIELHDFPITHTRSDTVTDISDLIDRTPVRFVSPNRPIRVAEIAEPSVVKKNDIIKIRYTAPGMEISTSGQAMADGPRGALIDVRNTTSKKIVQARIVDANTVEISTKEGVYAAK